MKFTNVIVQALQAQVGVWKKKKAQNIDQSVITSRYRISHDDVYGVDAGGTGSCSTRAQTYDFEESLSPRNIEELGNINNDHLYAFIYKAITYHECWKMRPLQTTPYRWFA